MYIAVHMHMHTAGLYTQRQRKNVIHDNLFPMISTYILYTHYHILFSHITITYIADEESIDNGQIELWIGHRA